MEDDIAEFIRTYPAPITDLPRLRTLLSAMTRPKRQQVLTAEKGYAKFLAECERKGKARAVKDAHRWVASGQWQGYLTSGEQAVAAAQVQRIPVDSDAGKAWAVLHRIAGISPFESSGHYYLTRPLCEQALAFARAPPESEWVFITSDEINQCGAWRSLLAEVLAGKARPELVQPRLLHGNAMGFEAPWPWPPRKDGSLYTGPPAELSEQELADYK